MDNIKSWFKANQNQIYPVLLVIIMLVGASFRLVGLNWDEGTYLHPDERHLLFVENDTDTVSTLSEYFDTENSPLNPYNRGKDYVYGTFPIFLVKYVTTALQEPDIRAGMDDYKLVGRQFSALADLMVVLVIYLIGSRLYDRRVGIVAAFFSAFAVLQIQLSHFFTVDTFLNLFVSLSIYFAVLIFTQKPNDQEIEVHKLEKPNENEEDRSNKNVFNIIHFLLFGLAFGFAMASKFSAFPAAFILPMAVFLRMRSLEPEERLDIAWQAVYNLVLAGAVSFITFRILQPYAFGGPGFFSLLTLEQPWLLNLNEKWVANIAELRRFVSGEIDWPPSIQWARRPVWFSFQNMTLWGMGLPMSIMAWAGFAWAGWKIWKHNKYKHLILWAWTAGYFIWRSLAFNPMMRYQLPVYPTFALFAGLAVVSLWDWSVKQQELKAKLSRVTRPAVIVIAALSLVGTFLWAYAFSRTYTVSVPRVESSRWIFENIPGPINLQIQTSDGGYNQPIPYSYNAQINSITPYSTTFIPKVDGALSSILLKHIVTPVTISIYDAEDLASPVAVQNKLNKYSRDGDLHRVAYKFDGQQLLTPDKTYLLRFELPLGINAADFNDVTVTSTRISDQSEQAQQLIVTDIEAGETKSVVEGIINVDEEHQLTGITAQFNLAQIAQPINVVIAKGADLSISLADVQTNVEISLHAGEYTPGQSIVFEEPIQVTAGETYFLQISVDEGAIPMSLFGSATANETTYDDGLPVRVEGYDGYGGIYQRDLNLEVYWDDADSGTKLERFLYTLNNSEYLFISSSRQWGSTTRIPERYPLVTVYYRELLGCPPENTIESCYNVATVGMFEGALGFELVQTFTTHPFIGPFSINDQASEEAFTVYDHPKVFIFQKSASYDPQTTADILGAVDVSNIIRLTPLEASGKPGSAPTLKLSDEDFTEQKSSGTWSDLFNVDGFVNSNQIITIIIWYLGISILGIAVYPLVRIALPGLNDKGYPISRAVGLLLLSYFSWLAGSIGLSFSKLTIGVIFFLLVALGGYLYYNKRDEFKQEWTDKASYFLKVELIIFVFFFFGLFIRLGNPDLWHAAFGGEKPMDFSYFNAVLKSTSFPPYDPWFAGGYINYYYYGFVYVGAFVKLLGVVPAVAYNLIIPTLFSFLAIGAFSVAWNFIQYRQQEKEQDASSVSPWAIGIVGALAFAVLGNLGSLEMIIEGFQKLGALGLYTVEASWMEKLTWSLRGFIEVLKGNGLPYSTGEWLWNPSRVIPGSAINEFPMFTVLYADLHAHLVALPMTLLSILWAMSMVFSNSWKNYIAEIAAVKNWNSSLLPFAKIGLSIFVGALTIGALIPTNTWDFPTFLAIAVVVFIYGLVKSILNKSDQDNGKTGWIRFVGLALFIGLSLTLFGPYSSNYVQGYTKLSPWTGEITPLGSYFVHWGVFIMILVSWFIWETRQWMANTPLSSLRKLEPYSSLIILFFIGLFVAVVVIQFPIPVTTELGDNNLVNWVVGLLSHGTSITWFVLPLAAWAGILLLRPKLSDAKRLVLFLVGTALVLTLMVDVVVVDGPGRMNTVFKFYLQAWTLLSLSSAAALGWIFTDIKSWNFAWRAVWQTLLIILGLSAALFPLTAATAKIKDRMAADAPNTLDGMAYMQYANYGVQDENLDEWMEMDLSQDYRAIQWMQANIIGSPVIVEANNPPYRWGSRYTIYTGLPGVIGWDWHQRQQREFVPGNSTGDRVGAIREFYETDNEEITRAFLQDYGVQFIVFGQLERATYMNTGFDKFDSLEGVLWKTVYSDKDTVIYEVLPDVLVQE